MTEKFGGEYGKISGVCAGISLFLIFRALKLKNACPQTEHEQLCQRGGLITENKGHQGRIETLMEWGNGTTGAPLTGQLGSETSQQQGITRSEELCIKMQQIHLHNLSFTERTAGTTKAVQEARLVLIAENSKLQSTN